MGTVIKSCYASPEAARSYIDMAAGAALHCLKQADMPAEQVDMLINIGVFRDDNMIEPALAPLIQRRLGLNLDPVKNAHLNRFTLAFDINDGENGFLTAACVADSFFATGAARNALIVAGDVHPSKTEHPDFPFQSVASAVLLTSTDDDRGFAGFHFKTSENGCHGFAANVDLSQSATGNREHLVFDIPDGYSDRLLTFTSEMIRDLAAEGRVDLSGIDYLLTSQNSGNFGEQIARAIGLSGRGQAIDLNGRFGNAHTSALSAGYQHLAASFDLKKQTRILFVAAGAGLSASCALYVA